METGWTEKRGGGWKMRLRSDAIYILCLVYACVLDCDVNNRAMLPPGRVAGDDVLADTISWIDVHVERNVW